MEEQDCMTEVAHAVEVNVKYFSDLIEIKCREHCGMRRAWDDGLCHATEQMCCLVPHSPIWAGTGSLARPEEKVAQARTADWDDL